MAGLDSSLAPTSRRAASADGHFATEEEAEQFAYDCELSLELDREHELWEKAREKAALVAYEPHI